VESSQTPTRGPQFGPNVLMYFTSLTNHKKSNSVDAEYSKKSKILQVITFI
jgi:hypothetical protein